MQTMELIGHHYRRNVIVILGNGRAVFERGMKLKTNRKVYDAADIHYYKSNVKTIEKDEIVEGESIWQNFYGKYIRCIYKGDILDIEPDCFDYIS